MRYKYFYSLLFFCALLLSCAKESATTNESKLIGEWEGQFSQPGFDDFQGSITISGLKIGSQAATGLYYNYGCTSNWVYLSNQNDKIFTFKENILTVTDICASGTIKLTYTDDDHFKYAWVDDLDATNTATGSITRKP